MKLNVPKELIELATIFKANNISLYIVGGFVRNSILGISDYGDIDLCSSAAILDIENLKDSSDLQIEVLNKDLNVCKIIYKGNAYEHAAFRQEICKNIGKHFPNEVKLVQTIDEDYLRRDFTINALYYNILEEGIIDPSGGIADLNNGLIKTIGLPKVRFCEDAIRMLRAIRFATVFGFNIEEKTFDAIKDNARLLLTINQDRKLAEYFKILYADEVIGDNKQQVIGLNLLAESGTLKYVLPELAMLYNEPKQGKTEFSKIVATVGFAKQHVRQYLIFVKTYYSYKKVFRKTQKDMQLILDNMQNMYNLKNKNFAIFNRNVINILKMWPKITKHYIKTSQIELLLSENKTIMPLLHEMLKADGLARSYGKNEGKIAKKFNVKIVKQIKKRYR